MRFNELYESYFNPTTTGMPTPDDILFDDPEYHIKNKKQTGEVVEMSPDEYISKCREGFKAEYGDLTSDLETGRDPELIEKYAEMMRTGTKFHMPTLDYRRGGFSQEGLHRAMAARQLGAVTMPVAILVSIK